MICIALFATAGTIIRQIIHTYSTAAKYALPIIGYLAAVVCFIGGMTYISDGSTVAHFVAGHVICGVAFITACVATTATSSTRFTFITQNSKKTDHAVPAKSFSSAQADILIILAVVFAVITWVWAFWLLGQSDIHTAYYVAGHVMAGLACICTSLVALVATIVRQIRNSYSGAERKWWRPRIGDGYTEYPVGTLGADECRPGQVFHRIHYDRSGFSLLQHIQQSNSAGCYLAERL